MAIGQVSEEEFSYQLLFKPSVSPLPEPDELNLIKKCLKQLAAKELLGESPGNEGYGYGQELLVEIRALAIISAIRGDFRWRR